MVGQTALVSVGSLARISILLARGPIQLWGFATINVHWVGKGLQESVTILATRTEDLKQHADLCIAVLTQRLVWRKQWTSGWLSEKCSPTLPVLLPRPTKQIRVF